MSDQSTTGTTDTTQATQATMPTKSYFNLGHRKIFQVPSVPTAAQMKGDHIQVRFGDLYVSRTMGWGELTKQGWMGLKLLYEQAKASGATAPSFSGSKEQYVPLTVTADTPNNGASGTVSLSGIVLMTFEVDPDVNLTPPAKEYSEGHPDTGDGDGEAEDEDDDDADSDDEDDEDED